MKNETSITNIFRPCRAGRRVDGFLGLKPQAESYCPIGAMSLPSRPHSRVGARRSRLPSQSEPTHIAR
jgi:hypothetical protein